jgi:hypothetical protein
MKDLYARLTLWLISPALQRHAKPRSADETLGPIFTGVDPSTGRPAWSISKDGSLKILERGNAGALVASAKLEQALARAEEILQEVQELYRLTEKFTHKSDFTEADRKHLSDVVSGFVEQRLERHRLANSQPPVVDSIDDLAELVARAEEVRRAAEESALLSKQLADRSRRRPDSYSTPAPPCSR